MRCLHTLAAALAVLVAAGPTVAGPACLNSKPCGDKCIPFHTTCHALQCGKGYFACHGSCISKHVYCRIN